eukprot:gene11413-7917_t
MSTITFSWRARQVHMMRPPPNPQPGEDFQHFNSKKIYIKIYGKKRGETRREEFYAKASLIDSCEKQQQQRQRYGVLACGPPGALSPPALHTPSGTGGATTHMLWLPCGSCMDHHEEGGVIDSFFVCFLFRCHSPSIGTFSLSDLLQLFVFCCCCCFAFSSLCILLVGVNHLVAGGTCNFVDT